MISVAACHISAGVQMQKESFTAHFWTGVQVSGLVSRCKSLQHTSGLVSRCKKNPLQHTSGMVSRYKKSSLHLTSGLVSRCKRVLCSSLLGWCPDAKSYSTLLGWCTSRSKKLQHTSGLVHVQMQKGTAHFWASACPDAAHFWAGVHASVIYFVTGVICCSYIYDMWTSVQVLQVYILGQCPGAAGSMFMYYKYPGQADA